MFDRFTDRTKTALKLAAQEANRLNHEYLGTEHILLGLVQEGSGVAANVLKNMAIDLNKIRTEVEKIVKTPPMATMGQLPFTPRMKEMLELSMEQASKLGHHSIGTEHLLLGLIQVNEGTAAQVLLNLGVQLEDVRREVLEFLGPEDTGGEPGKRVMRLAARAASVRNHDFLGTEHILLALLEEQGEAARALATLGIDPRALGSEVHEAAPPQPGGGGARPHLPLTPGARQVLELALDEARGARREVRSSDLLLGLLRCETGAAPRLLRARGLEVEALRAVLR